MTRYYRTLQVDVPQLPKRRRDVSAPCEEHVGPPCPPHDTDQHAPDEEEEHVGPPYPPHDTDQHAPDEEEEQLCSRHVLMLGQTHGPFH